MAACPHDVRETHPVMIAMNDSDEAFNAFDWYMSHFYTAGQEIIIVYVLQSNDVGMCKTPVHSTDPMVFKKINKKADDVMRKITDKVRPRLEQIGVKTKILCLNGKAGDAIVKAGKSHHVSCIVTGTRQRNGLKRTLDGSVSDFLCHHAHCPVLVCTATTS